MKCIDLFAGCGGLSAGFIEAGFDVVAGFESWGTASKCYRLNFDHRLIQMDLSDLNLAIEKVSSFKPEIIIGGPPCQDFSHAGKRVEGDKANLTIIYAQIIAAEKPKWFVMENVDRVMKSQSYKIARELFKSAGYGLTEQILDASKCGVPQKRKRFFSIGLQNADDGFLDEILIKNQSKNPLTLRDYFSNSLKFEHYYRHPRNYNRRAIFSIDEPSPTVRGVNRPVPQGYPGHHNDSAPISENIYSLSTKERAAIQTFPENFKWIGTKTEIEQMIGNAVPIKLAKYIGDAIAQYIILRENDGIREFQEMVN
jgi:DNA (cytosine-5)-methyltransferase 1